MNAQQQADDGRTDEWITLAEADERSSPAQGDAFQRIEAALEEADDSYSAQTYYEHTCKDTSMIQISSSDCYWKEGELGDARFHISIGPSGGLKKATKRSEISHNERDFLAGAPNKRFAWSQLLQAIERAE